MKVKFQFFKDVKFSKTKGKKYKHMIQGFLGILDGFIRMATFGGLWSNFQFTYVTNVMLKQSTNGNDKRSTENPQ